MPVVTVRGEKINVSLSRRVNAILTFSFMFHDWVSDRLRTAAKCACVGYKCAGLLVKSWFDRSWGTYLDRNGWQNYPHFLNLKITVYTIKLRAGINSVKTNHLVNFIASTNFIQDVAYGTKKLKLDSEEKITIQNLIRTMLPSQIIKQYISYCQKGIWEQPKNVNSFLLETLYSGVTKGKYTLQRSSSDLLS